jgi:hypothetical protein
LDREVVLSERQRRRVARALSARFRADADALSRGPLRVRREGDEVWVSIEVPSRASVADGGRYATYVVRLRTVDDRVIDVAHFLSERSERGDVTLPPEREGLLPHHPRIGDPYFEHWLRTYGEEVWDALDTLPFTDAARADAITDVFLELALTTTHAANINLGRFGLLALPERWLRTTLTGRVFRILEQGTDWEFARAIELAELLEPALKTAILERGRTSADPEIRALCED